MTRDTEEHKKVYEKNAKPYEFLLAHQLSFNFKDTPLYWRDRSPIKTFYDNAFSIAVPLFEDFMIEGLKKIKPSVGKASLVQQIHQFCEQEHNHAEGHRSLNKKLGQQNIRVKKIHTRAKMILDQYKKYPLSKKLQLFASIETFTSVMAKFYLVTSEKEEVFEEVQRLLVWHSIEELEHRCVAYDVHVYVNGKHVVDVFFVLNFCRKIGFYLMISTFSQILSTRSIFKRKTWTDLFWLLSPKGPNLMILRGMFNFLRTSYNPKSYFDEPILNEKVKTWEKFFHIGK